MLTAEIYNVETKETMGILKFIVPPYPEDVIMMEKQYVVLKRGHEFSKEPDGKIKIRLVINVAEVKSNGMVEADERAPQKDQESEEQPEQPQGQPQQGEVVDQGLVDAQRAEQEAEARASQAHNGIPADQSNGGQNGSGKNRGRKRSKNKNKGQQPEQTANKEGGEEAGTEEHV